RSKRDWSSDVCSSDLFKVIHFREKSQSSLRNRLHHLYIDGTVIADKLTAASEQEILAFSRFQNECNPMFRCPLIGNAFAAEFIHEIAEFHHVSQHYMLMSRPEKNMSFYRNDRNVDINHFSDERRTYACSIDHFLGRHIAIGRLDCKVGIFCNICHFRLRLHFKPE